MYDLVVDWAPPYELLVSLRAYTARAEHKTLDLGADWARGVRKRLTAQLSTELRSRERLSDLDLLDLLVWQCPEERDVPSFLQWLSCLTPGELYERLAAYIPTRRRSILGDLASIPNRYVPILQGWDEQYFSRIDPAILCGLQANAAEHQALLDRTAPGEVVEIATNGLTIPSDMEPATVVLVPQYHCRPWNVRGFYEGVRIIEYPADALPLAPGDVPPRLLRLTRALSDESRLRILRFLGEEATSFMDIVRLTGLSKSTIHHHLVALRAAGLVLVHDVGEKQGMYSVRHDAVEEMSDSLRTYLNGK